MKSPTVYILASQKRGTLYTGVTGRLAERIAEHREGHLPGFTREYRVTRLVHLEGYDSIETAISREKAIKKWRRAWKIELIENGNPDWRTLWFDLNRQGGQGQSLGPRFRGDDMKFGLTSPMSSPRKRGPMA